MEFCTQPSAKDRTMNFSFVTTEIHNKLINSSDPQIREIGKLMQNMMKVMQSEMDTLKHQVAELRSQQRR